MVFLINNQQKKQENSTVRVRHDYLNINLNEIINKNCRYLRYILCRNYIYYLPVNKENDKLAGSSLLCKSDK